jgi:hypothetical protein
VGKEMMEIATIEGAVNGPDGVGVHWEDMDGDGVVEILAGLPIIDLEHRTIPDSYARRFEIHRWDAVEQSFVPVGVRVLDSTK